MRWELEEKFQQRTIIIYIIAAVFPKVTLHICWKYYTPTVVRCLMASFTLVRSAKNYNNLY